MLLSCRILLYPPTHGFTAPAAFAEDRGYTYANALRWSGPPELSPTHKDDSSAQVASGREKHSYKIAYIDFQYRS